MGDYYYWCCVAAEI